MHTKSRATKRKRPHVVTTSDEDENADASEELEAKVKFDFVVLNTTHQVHRHFMNGANVM